MADKDMIIQEHILSSLQELSEDGYIVSEDLSKKIQTKDESEFLENIRERILVLFEGLQTKDDKNLDKKLDMTLNFLQFLLAAIEKRLEK